MSKQKPIHDFLDRRERSKVLFRGLIREFRDPEYKSFSRVKHVSKLMIFVADWDRPMPGRYMTKSWKEFRKTQYRPEGRNAYKITLKYKFEKCEKVEGSVRTQFATSDEWKTDTFHYDYGESSSWYSHDFPDLWDLEEKFKLHGIVILEFWDDPDPETRCVYKVYGDRKEGVRRYLQQICDRCGGLMEVEYI